MKVLLVGSGGREHAIAWKLAQSKELDKLYIASGNCGTAECGENIDIKADESDKLLEFAREKKIELLVVGPEGPLTAGIVDKFEAAGIMAFGPTGAAAQLEGDKVFSKHLMRSASISTAEAKIFDNFKSAKTYIASRDEPVVVKAAGLAKGKGVFVCDDPSDGILAAEKIMVERVFGEAGDRIVVEDKLLGEEASILTFVDGHNIYVMESSQDHMRMKSDLLEVLVAVCEGRLEEVSIEWDPRPAVCVVMASGGYPDKYEKGKKITGLEEVKQIEDVIVFHAGTAEKDGDIVTNGGRVLDVTALGRTIPEAKTKAYEGVEKIHFDGAYYRGDIADKAIKVRN